MKKNKNKVLFPALVSDVMLELHVPNFETIKKFYGDLGFKIVWERKPSEKKGYLVMKRHESVLNFFCGNEEVYKRSFFKRFSKETPRGYAVEIIIPIDDIDSFYRQIEKKYPKLIIKILEKRYDKLDFRMTDPFGFYLRFVERYNWIDDRDKNGNPLRL